MKSIDKSFYLQLGYIIKKAREEKGYSLQEVSDKVNLILSTSKIEKRLIRQSLNKMELGKLRIDNDIYQALCTVLEIDPKRIFDENKPLTDDTLNQRVKQIENDTGLKVYIKKEGIEPITEHDLKEAMRTILTELDKMDNDE